MSFFIISLNNFLHHLILFVNIWAFSFLWFELLQISVILNTLLLQIYQLFQTWSTLMITFIITILFLTINLHSFSHKEVFVILYSLNINCGDWIGSFNRGKNILLQSKAQGFTYLDVNKWCLSILFVGTVIAKNTKIINFILLLIVLCIQWQKIGNFFIELIGSLFQFQQSGKLLIELLMKMSINQFISNFPYSLLNSCWNSSPILVQLKYKKCLCPFVLTLDMFLMTKIIKYLQQIFMKLIFWRNFLLFIFLVFQFSIKYI